MAIAIKVSEENYRRLALSGKLREQWARPVSMNDAITYLYSKRKVSELAGSWSMTDAEKLKKDLRKGWNKSA